MADQVNKPDAFKRFQQTIAKREEWLDEFVQDMLELYEEKGEQFIDHTFDPIDSAGVGEVGIDYSRLVTRRLSDVYPDGKLYGDEL